MLGSLESLRKDQEEDTRTPVSGHRPQPRELSRQELSAIRGGKTRHDYAGTVDLGYAFRREIINNI